MVSGVEAQGHPNCYAVAVRDRSRKRWDPIFAWVLRCMLSFLCIDSSVSSNVRPFQCTLKAKFRRNSALYVSSRTLFVLAQRSEYGSIRRTLGRTNNGHTPLAAIIVSFLPGVLAFLATKATDITFQEVSEHND